MTSGLPGGTRPKPPSAHRPDQNPGNTIKFRFSAAVWRGSGNFEMPTRPDWTDLLRLLAAAAALVITAAISAERLMVSGQNGSHFCFFENFM